MLLNVVVDVMMLIVLEGVELWSVEGGDIYNITTEAGRNFPSSLPLLLTSLIPSRVSEAEDVELQWYTAPPAVKAKARARARTDSAGMGL